MAFLSLGAIAFAGGALAKQPAEIVGTWTLSLAEGRANCRVMLQPQRSDRGDFFIGIPAACRHAMPGIEKVGRWAMPDDQHIALDAPSGAAVLVFAAAGDGYRAAGAEGTYTLKAIDADGGRPAFEVTTAASAPGFATIQSVASKRDVKASAAPRETANDLAGRYAVLRDKRDTGCMVTLDDKSRGKAGGDRAQLAPGCRDQGIVIFDPSSWQIIKGELVLTARAGHKTKLTKQDDGSWSKDLKEGGKPLGLKKL